MPAESWSEALPIIHAVARGNRLPAMGSEERMRELILRFTEDPEWLPSVSQDITDILRAFQMRELGSS